MDILMAPGEFEKSDVNCAPLTMTLTMWHTFLLDYFKVARAHI